MSVPFPCAVYSRQRSCEPFRFSHMVARGLAWDLPGSLDSEALREYGPSGVRGVARRARDGVFLVLVGGDLAQPVSLNTLRGHRQRFLFPGSEYCREAEYTHPSELSADCVMLVFHAGMGVYGQRLDLGWRLQGVTPFESGLVLLPRCLREGDLPFFGRCVSQQLDKCIRDSVLVAGTTCYHAASLAPLHPPKQAKHKRVSRRRDKLPAHAADWRDAADGQGDARQAGDAAGLDRVVHAVLGEPAPVLVES